MISTIRSSPYPVPTRTNGMQFVHVITAENGQRYVYENREFICDAETHVQLASETKCERCPKCQQLLLRDKSAWDAQQVSGLGLMKMESREDGLRVLEMIEGGLEKTTSVEERAHVLCSQAEMLLQLGRPNSLQAAEEAYRLVKNARAATMLANSLVLVGRPKEAEEYFREAVSLPGAGQRQRLDYASALKFSGAWAEAAKIQKPEQWKIVQELNLSEWDGTACETLHVIFEDGAGDFICIARYFDMIRARGVQKIIVCVLPRHHGMLDLIQSQTWMPELRVVTGENIDAFRSEVRVAIGSSSLEFALQLLPSDVPPSAPWSATKEHAGKYQNLPKGRPLVGICWAAGELEKPWADEGAMRKLTNSQVREIVQRVDTVQWVNLQYKGPAPIPEVISPTFDTWCETAGLIENLDAVVTVDTSILHLAVGMRKPTFILVSGMCSWRLAHGDNFYPGAKVFQNFAFGFDNSVRDLIAHLQQHIS